MHSDAWHAVELRRLVDEALNLLFAPSPALALAPDGFVIDSDNETSLDRRDPPRDNRRADLPVPTLVESLVYQVRDGYRASDVASAMQKIAESSAVPHPRRPKTARSPLSTVLSPSPLGRDEFDTIIVASPPL